MDQSIRSKKSPELLFENFACRHYLQHRHLVEM